MPIPEEKNRFSSVIYSPRTRHSKKPDEIYNLIETMYPNRKYLELFARKKYSDKWTVFGLDLNFSTECRRE